MQREAQLEQEFIKALEEQGYTYNEAIKDRSSLEQNFRRIFEKRNYCHLSDSEFARLKEMLTISDVFEASKLLREKNTFKRDDDTPLVFDLLNTKDWCKNEFEIVNQLRINTENSFQRYDVIILINGLPLVQIELKSILSSPKKAMEQIVRYKNEPGNGYFNSLLCFMQLFIVSNGGSTYYFSNNRSKHFSFNADELFLPIYQYADENNQKISNLFDFAKTFLKRCQLAELIGRYMVLVECEQKMLIMRPYQINAVKAIIKSIDENRGNGYIWHTTGSGKTLTSFKASTILKENEDIEKCLFVVDRKDLDKQTRDEFNKFQKGCVEENTNTAALVTRLLSDDYKDKVIVTTIQKLGLALNENSVRNEKRKTKGKETYAEILKPLRDKRVVIIFDECHRSQFGENHQLIKEFFPKAQLFGFTGTPIFPDNAVVRQISGTQASYKTTQDIFQNCLHKYTITNAIEDRTVLRFHVEYFKSAETANPKDKNYKRSIIKTILEKHNALTFSQKYNAVFATASINDAIEYYELFKQIQNETAQNNPDFIPLHIACVFSPPAEGNKDTMQIQEDLLQEQEDNKVDPEGKKSALKKIMADYNACYGTAHVIEEFDAYYQDIQQRIKNQQYPSSEYKEKKIDITIVVDMLLTGFDSKFLNTLYVEKNLKYHGLIQAFSRTNRILNDTKPYGNIVDFRQQGEEVDKAIKLFSGIDNTDNAKEIWLVDPAPKVIEQLHEKVTALKNFMQNQGLDFKPEDVDNLKGDIARCGFINAFKEVQRLKTRLDQYTDLEQEEKEEIENLLPEALHVSFRSKYLETAQKLREKQYKEDSSEKESAEQTDFEFVLFSSAIIDYDYIMKLIADFTQPDKKVVMSREELLNLLFSTSNFMDEKEDIRDYILSLKENTPLTEEEIKQGYLLFKENKIKNAILALAEEFNLAPEALQAFVDETVKRDIFDAEKLTELFAPLELGWRERAKKEIALMDNLTPLLYKLNNGKEISGLGAYENK